MLQTSQRDRRLPLRIVDILKPHFRQPCRQRAKSDLAFEAGDFLAQARVNAAAERQRLHVLARRHCRSPWLPPHGLGRYRRRQLDRSAYGREKLDINWRQLRAIEQGECAGDERAHRVLARMHLPPAHTRKGR